MAEWAQGLAGMTGDDIKRGLDEWQGEWPPSLPEFVAACKGQQDGDHWQHRTAAYKRLTEPERQKADAQTAAAEIAKMRECLRGLKS